MKKFRNKSVLKEEKNKKRDQAELYSVSFKKKLSVCNAHDCIHLRADFTKFAI